MRDLSITNNPKCQKCHYSNINTFVVPNANPIRFIKDIIIIYRYCHLTINNLCTIIGVKASKSINFYSSIYIQKCGTTGTLALRALLSNSDVYCAKLYTWH